MDAMDQNEGGRITANENPPVAGYGTDTGMVGPAGGWSSGTGGGSDTCPTCGRSSSGGGELEQFLGRLGVTPEMLDNLKGQFQNIDIDEYLTTAREYLKDGSRYAKENPGNVAAGIVALALGAGLLWRKCRTTQDAEDRSRQLELKQALRGRKYRLDEVLRELDVAV